MDETLRKLRNPMGIEEQAVYERSRCRANQHEPKVIRFQDLQEDENKELPDWAGRRGKISAWEETRCQFCNLLLDSTDPVSAEHEQIYKISINFVRDQMSDQVWDEIKTRIWCDPEHAKMPAYGGWYSLSPETAEYLNSVMMQQELIRQYAIDCQVDPDKIKIITPDQELNGAMMLNPNLAKLAIKWKAKSLRDAQK